jgi:hypothetical protein
MLTVGFSEFTYGYALTDNLVNGALAGVGGVPLFPSLREEGRAGGGYDVEIPARPVPLFLQFKVPQVMRRRSDWTPEEPVVAERFGVPYYRMHLRARRHSRQHDALLAHEAAGRLVFYAAPRFHRGDDLNRLYVEKRVHRDSVFVRPGAIGPLPDDEPHHLAYEPRGRVGVLRSDPRVIDGAVDADAFEEAVRAAVARAEKLADPLGWFAALASDIVAAYERAVAAPAIPRQPQKVSGDGDAAGRELPLDGAEEDDEPATPEIERRAPRRRPEETQTVLPFELGDEERAMEEVPPPPPEARREYREQVLERGARMDPVTRAAFYARFLLDAGLVLLGAEGEGMIRVGDR